MRRYLRLCALSGVVWAGIASLIGYSHIPGVLWGGIALAPLVGVVVGLVYLPAYRAPRWGRALASLVTLYLAVALFGLGVGAADALRDIPGRRTGAVVLQGLYTTLWGITFTGYVLVLWPLAAVNHWVVGRYGRAATT